MPSTFKYARDGVDIDRDIIVNDLRYSEEDFNLIARESFDEFLTPFD